MVPIEHSEIGTEVQVERPEGVVEAVVADRSFFEPEKAEQQLSAEEGGQAV
jgi:hypothetical protein